MLCKTANGNSTYNDLRLRDNCNVIIVMRGLGEGYADNHLVKPFAGVHRPNYALNESSIINDIQVSDKTKTKKST